MIYVNNLKKESVQMRFGERLKTARNKKELTQDNVAVIFKVSRKTISSWENENSYPDINSLIQISNFYHISLDTLLKEDVGMKEFLDKKDVKNGLRPLQKQLSIMGLLIGFCYFILPIIYPGFYSNFMFLLLVLLFPIFNKIQKILISFQKSFGIYEKSKLLKLLDNVTKNIKYITLLIIILIICLLANVKFNNSNSRFYASGLIIVIIICLVLRFIEKNKATTKK